MYFRFSMVLLTLVFLLIGLACFNGDAIGNSVSRAGQSTLTQEGPEKLIPITSETVNRLEQVARLGQGRVYGATWLNQGQTLAVCGSLGIWL